MNTKEWNKDIRKSINNAHEENNSVRIQEEEEEKR